MSSSDNHEPLGRILSILIAGKPATRLLRRTLRVLWMFVFPVRLVLRTTKSIFLRISRLVWTTGPGKIDAYLARQARSRISKLVSIDETSIVLATMQGEYTCNPKYIAEELLRRELPYRLTWVMNTNRIGPVPREINLVQNRSSQYFEEVARAKIVIQNGHLLQRNGIVKRDGQNWLQTWHGSLGLKRLEGAGGDQSFFDLMRDMQSRDTDFVISNSAFENDVFENTYWPGVPVLQLGHARNDILFGLPTDKATLIRRKVLSRLNIEDTDQKFLLFGPTQNDGRQLKDFWEIDWTQVTAALKGRFGGHWEVLIRTHNRDKGAAKRLLRDQQNICHDASRYPDMQELLFVADAGVTNYSSWICDFIIQRRPSFIYGPDINQYEETRGFYHEFKDTPFDVAISLDDLLLNIKQFDETSFTERVDAFFEKCGLIDDGAAASRIVDEIERLMAQ